MQKNLSIISLFVYSILLVFQTFPVQAQLVVNGGQTPEQMIEEFLGAGVVVDNVVINCLEIAYGTFDGSNSNIGIDSGIILTTGSIDNAVGPNDDDGVGSEQSSGAPGDADLSEIVNLTTEDACILEFDFIPASDELSFTYVFGSDEYLEFVGDNFNDVFAFFITGPNPAGGLYENQNIALIPDTDIPVSIDSVNEDVNSEYFINNGSGEDPIDPNSTVQYDGFTIPLSATIDLVPCQSYHLKLAIADAGDGVWDSGVFLEAGSLNTDIVSVATATAIGTNTAEEGCLDAAFVFTSNFELTEDLEIFLNVGGTAENGVDYTTIPTSIVIPVGQNTAIVNIEALEDDELEGIEEITISFDLGVECEGLPQSATLFLVDASDAGTVSANPTIVCNGGTVAVASSDAIVAEGDIPMLAVHNSPDGNTSMEGFTIYALSSDDNLLNNGSLPQNIPLYISNIVGNNDGSGMPDLNDVCLKVSPPVEVVFLEEVSFMIDEYCDLNTGDYIVSFQLEGGLPAYDGSAYTVSGDYAGEYFFGDDPIAITFPEGTANQYTLNALDGLECVALAVNEEFDCTKNPIELLQFEGEAQANGNYLQWITASETDNDYFQLARSTDGKNFMEITQVKSQGNSQNLQFYEFLDRNAPAGLTYYRLTQYDYNGQSETFPVISLQRGESTDLKIIQLAPIPTRNLLNLSYTAASSDLLEIAIYNTAGQVVLAQTFIPSNSGMNFLQLEVNSLLSGVYLLHVTNQEKSVSRMLIKE